MLFVLFYWYNCPIYLCIFSSQNIYCLLRIFLFDVYCLCNNNVLLGFVKATCSDTDASAKPGVNCVRSEDIESAVHLLQVLKPELHKRSVANKCFDMKIKAHMSEDEIISHCINNFALRVMIFV